MSADPPADAPLSVEQAALDELWEDYLFTANIMNEDAWPVMHEPRPTEDELTEKRRAIEQAIAAAAVTEAEAALRAARVLVDCMSFEEWDNGAGWVTHFQDKQLAVIALSQLRQALAGAAGSGSTP